MRLINKFTCRMIIFALDRLIIAPYNDIFSLEHFINCPNKDIVLLSNDGALVFMNKKKVNRTIISIEVVRNNENI